MDKLVMLDPGHGGEDPGAINSNGLHEADLVLGLCNDLAAELFNMGIPHQFTRKDRKTSLWPSVRAQKANELKADLFISLHLNSAENKEATGTEVCYFGRATRDMAADLSGRISAALGTVNRGPKERPDLGVLRRTKMPALLIEFCFIEKDIEKIFDKNLRKSAIISIADYIREVLS
jgi:N-acetylmuramoyl-L-alanine amidase